MGLRVSGKNFSLGDSLRAHVLERIEGAATNYFDGSITGHVVVDHEGSGYRTDCTLHLASGMTLHSEGRSHEPRASFEQAADRLEGRLRRYKTRLKKHHGSSAHPQPTQAEIVSDYTIEPPGPDHAEEETYHPAVIAETTRELKELPVSDAVRDLDLSGAPVLIFKHSSSGRVNIVYRRPDGNIGWLDPGAPERKARS